jgi:hypothetical protein
MQWIWIFGCERFTSWIIAKIATVQRHHGVESHHYQVHNFEITHKVIFKYQVAVPVRVTVFIAFATQTPRPASK